MIRRSSTTIRKHRTRKPCRWARASSITSLSCKALKDGGFDGSIAYEMCSPLLHGGDLATLDCYARRFIEYMSSLGE